jgi:hypothetical protein
LKACHTNQRRKIMKWIGWTALGTGLLVAGGAGMLGFFTVAEVQGDGEIARGELMRYFAEMAWHPTALLI